MNPTRLMRLPATIFPRDPADDLDEYNDEELVDGDPIELDGTPGNGVWLEQADRSENAGANTSVQTWTLFLPSGKRFTEVDAIEVIGMTFEAVGPPWPATNPRTLEQTHTQATVRRVA